MKNDNPTTCNCPICQAEEKAGLPFGSLTPESDLDMDSIFKILGIGENTELRNPAPITGEPTEEQIQELLKELNANDSMKGNAQKLSKEMGLTVEEIDRQLAINFLKGMSVQESRNTLIEMAPNKPKNEITEINSPEDFEKLMSQIFGLEEEADPAKSAIFDALDAGNVTEEHQEGFANAMDVLVAAGYELVNTESDPKELAIMQAKFDTTKFKQSFIRLGACTTESEAELMNTTYKVIVNRFGIPAMDKFSEIANALDTAGITLVTKEELEELRQK